MAKGNSWTKNTRNIAKNAARMTFLAQQSSVRPRAVDVGFTNAQGILPAGPGVAVQEGFHLKSTKRERMVGGSANDEPG